MIAAAMQRRANPSIVERSLLTVLMRLPYQQNRPGLVIKELISSIDLAPTLLEAAGVAVPPEMQGCSFLPAQVGKQHCA